MQLFYFIWGNVLVAFGFLLATFHTCVKTAVVSGAVNLNLTPVCDLCMRMLMTSGHAAYIWVVGSGLLGYLMFQQFIERGYSWCEASVAHDSRPDLWQNKQPDHDDVVCLYVLLS